MSELTKDTHFKLLQSWKGRALTKNTHQPYWQLEDLTQNLKKFHEDLSFCVKFHSEPSTYMTHENGLTVAELSNLIELNEKTLEMHTHLDQAYDIASSMNLEQTIMEDLVTFSEGRIRYRLDNTVTMLELFAPVGCTLTKTDEPAIRFVEVEN